MHFQNLNILINVQTHIETDTNIYELSSLWHTGKIALIRMGEGTHLDHI